MIKNFITGFKNTGIKPRIYFENFHGPDSRWSVSTLHFGNLDIDWISGVDSFNEVHTQWTWSAHYGRAYLKDFKYLKESK